MTGLEWLLLVGFALFIATLAALPDIYAFVRDCSRWVPVNAPPYVIGDDYHYYSLLNLIHRRLLNVFRETKLDVIPLAIFNKFQIVVFLFNILPYHIGYIIHDRRLGILFVRIWNTTWLMLALMVYAKLLFGALQLEASPILLAFAATLFFFAYPLPLSIRRRFPWIVPFGPAIWTDLLRKDSIFINSQGNDLQRAMHMATSGHLLLWSSALLFWCIGRGSLNEFYYLIPAGAGPLLFFTYFPAAFVYGFLYFAGLVAENQFMVAGGWLLICMGLSVGYLKAIFKDDIGKEVFVTSNSDGRIFEFKRIGSVAIPLLLPLISYALLKDIVSPPFFWLMFFGAWVFSVSTLAASHQGNRFWVRGALVVYQLFAVVTGIALLERYIPCCKEWVASVALLLLVCAMAFYFYRNAVFLFDACSTRSPNWIGVQQLSHDCLRGSKLIATDSVEVGFYIYLYTGDSCLLKHYSIQNKGYKKHLEEFCLNFKVSGYELSEILDLFSRNIEMSDWFWKRIDALHHSTYPAALTRMRTLQDMATYREYNQRILDDGLIDRNGWTDRGKELISAIWWDIEARKVLVDRVMLDPNRGLREALNCISMPTST